MLMIVLDVTFSERIRGLFGNVPQNEKICK